MTTLEELEKLLRLATTRPWKANTADKTGEDWLICSLGNSNEDGQDWIVTTDRIRASELDGDAKFDAALICAAINALPGLIESARRVEEMREELDKEQVSHLKTRVMLTRSREAAEPFVAALFNDGETWEPDRIKLRHVQALAAALKEKP